MSRRRVLVDHLPKSGNNRVPISPDEVTHLASVLRLSDGDEVEAIDGQGSWARGVLRLKKKSADVEIDFGTLENEPNRLLGVTLVTAPLKGDAMDWLIEKAVELGATAIHPVVTDHSVVRVRGDKGPAELQTRWQRIADQALKQCGRRYQLKISPPCPLPEWLATATPGVPRAWLHESERHTSPHLASWLQKHDRKLPLEILLGPEGGFSYAEIEMLGRSGLFSPVSLGSTILRAETAGIAAIVLAGAHEVTEEAMLQTETQKNPHPLAFKPLSDGLGFHPFSDGLPYAPASKTSAKPTSVVPAKVSAPRLSPAVAVAPQATLDLATQQALAKVIAHHASEQAREATYGFRYMVSRLLAFTLDNLLIMVGIAAGTSFYLAHYAVPSGREATLQDWAYIILVMGSFQWALLAFQEVAFGTSVGKRIFGMRIPGGAAAVFLRSFFFVPSFLCMGIGLLPMLIDRRRRCLHDLIADTQPEFVES